MLDPRPAGESRRCGEKPKTGEVYLNATADVPQAFDEPAVEDTPGGVAVQHENDRSTTFVDVMQSCLPNGGEAALEREEPLCKPSRRSTYDNTAFSIWLVLG